MQFRNKEIPVQIVAALVQMCVAVDELLEIGELTPDIAGELQTIRPLLLQFVAAA